MAAAVDVKDIDIEAGKGDDKNDAEAKPAEVELANTSNTVDPQKIPSGSEDEVLEEDDIRNRLTIPKTQCCPGAPDWCGPRFCQWNNFDNTCGFNPSLYLVMFVLIAGITLIVEYS